MLTKAEKKYLAGKEFPDVNYERVLNSRVRKKSLDAIDDLLVVCQYADRLSPEKGGRKWDKKINETCQRLFL